MIDPRELRIGNLVYQGVTSTAKNEWQAVRQIKSNVISTDEFQSIPFEMLNGILITEEWLIKLGFNYWPDAALTGHELTIQ
jgi:hypothetical protein